MTKKPTTTPLAEADAEAEAIQSIKQLRRFNLKCMVRAARGHIDYSSARATTTFGQQVYNTLKIEKEYARINAKLGDDKKIKPDF